MTVVGAMTAVGGIVLIALDTFTKFLIMLILYIILYILYYIIFYSIFQCRMLVAHLGVRRGVRWW
jgi:uncharacterized membrane protein